VFDLAANSSHQDALKSAQADIEKERFESAAVTVDGVLGHSPDLFDAHYMAAVCARYMNQSEKAAHHIAHMKTIMPELGRVFQEEGHLYAKSDPDKALRAYQFACQKNPTLLASWKAQAHLLAAKNMKAAAEMALANGKSVAAQPKALQAAMNHMYEGRLVQAEEMCRAFLNKHRHHVEGMRILAQLALRHGENDQAEFLLESILEFHPHLHDIRLEYIEVLKNRQKFEQAAGESAYLVEHAPERVTHLSVHAVNMMQAGRYDEALALFDRVLERVPKDAGTWTSKGHALKTLGREDEAVEAYRKAIEGKTDHGDGFYSLANLKTYKFSEAEREQMDILLKGDDLLPHDAAHICFALAKAYEDEKAYELAFTHYEKGNELKRIQSGYTPDVMQAELEAQKSACTAELFSKQGGKGHAAPDPIFIVGLPRAGSTLIEQILASHSQIDGTLELPNILSLSHKLRGPNRADYSLYPRVLHELDGDKLAELGRDFIEETRLAPCKARRSFTDKMPNNFRHIGLIHLILPNAKIIDARRNPMDCCFSGFKQLFAQGQEFTYGLEEIGRYYADYVSLMAHWHEVLPGKILHVQHEDVLDDLEGQVRRMLDYLGLPFEQACLEFHNTERAVRTASSAQVRQPLNRKGVDAWRPFEAYLDALKQALGDHYHPEAAGN
jgi:tetratricopeptide (TPR) repeat protein